MPDPAQNSEAPQNFPTLGVIILGAGASTRMGGPKLLLPWRDTTIIGHLIRQWSELGAGQITVVRRVGDPAFSAELDRLNFPSFNRIENPHPEREMFSSIVCAAKWPGWKSEIASWAIVLGDQPHLRLETLRQLLKFQLANADAVCQPSFEGHARHPVILPRAVFGELKYSNAESLKDFLKLVVCRHVQCSVADPGLSLDLDTLEDYKQAQAQAHT